MLTEQIDNNVYCYSNYLRNPAFPLLFARANDQTWEALLSQALDLSRHKPRSATFQASPLTVVEAWHTYNRSSASAIDDQKTSW